MIMLEKFKKEHFEDLREEPSVAYLLPHLTEAHLEALEKLPYSYSGIKNGKVVFCGGVSEYWPGRGEAWIMLNKNRDMIAITKMAKKFVEACPIRRIEVSVDVNFPQGHAWAKLLGFKLEAEFMEAYLPDGRDCSLYSRVRSA